MSRLVAFVGMRAGRLTVISRAKNANNGKAKWTCRCDCGNTTVVLGERLKSGGTISCGCFRRETTIKHFTTHGMTNTAAHQMFLGARRRAKLEGTECSLVLADIIIPEFCPVFGTKLVCNTASGPLPSSPSLDRIDPTKGYVKSNIWVISHRANRMKSDATLEELQMLVKAIRERLAA